MRYPRFSLKRFNNRIKANEVCSSFAIIIHDYHRKCNMLISVLCMSEEYELIILQSFANHDRIFLSQKEEPPMKKLLCVLLALCLLLPLFGCGAEERVEHDARLNDIWVLDDDTGAAGSLFAGLSFPALRLISIICFALSYNRSEKPPIPAALPLPMPK